MNDKYKQIATMINVKIQPTKWLEKIGIYDNYYCVYFNENWLNNSLYRNSPFHSHLLFYTIHEEGFDILFHNLLKYYIFDKLGLTLEQEKTIIFDNDGICCWNALLDNPNDEAALLAYTDWLIEQGYIDKPKPIVKSILPKRNKLKSTGEGLYMSACFVVLTPIIMCYILFDCIKQCTAALIECIYSKK